MKSNVSSSIKAGGEVKRFLSIGVLFCILIVFFFVIVRPQNRNLNRLREQYETDLKRLKKATDMTLTVPAAREEIEKLKSKYLLLMDRVPAEENLPYIIKQLDGELRKLDIRLISLVPETAMQEEGDNLRETTIDILMEANFTTLGRFLEAVSKMRLLFKVKDLRVEKEPGEGSLSIRLLLSTYSSK